MDADSRISCIIILILLFLAAFFAVSETSFASCSQSKIKVMADRGDNRAKKAAYILDNFELTVSTLLICTNIVHISVATIVTVLVTRLWGLSYVSISTIVTTIVVFFVGEMLPKSIAKKNPEGFAVPCAGTVLLLMKLFGPLARLLTKIGLLAAKLSKGDPELSVTEDELLDIIEDMAEDGVIEEDQKDIMSSVLEFTDTKTGRILTPKKDIVGYDVNLSDKEIFERVLHETHSRVVIYDGVIDNIVGILQIRKYIKAYLENREIPKLKDMIDEPFYVLTKTEVDDVLEQMSDARQNIAVVKGVNGHTIGIVSIEDILEELVGDILDEKDEEVEA